MAKRTILTAEIGLFVRRIRLEKGMSQEQYADACGVHRTYVGHVERGERAMLVETASVLADGLGMSLGEFFSKLDESRLAKKRASKSKTGVQKK